MFSWSLLFSSLNSPINVAQFFENFGSGEEQNWYDNITANILFLVFQG